MCAAWIKHPQVGKHPLCAGLVGWGADSSSLFLSLVLFPLRRCRELEDGERGGVQSSAEPSLGPDLMKPVRNE